MWGLLGIPARSMPGICGRSFRRTRTKTARTNAVRSHTRDRHAERRRGNQTGRNVFWRRFHRHRAMHSLHVWLHAHGNNAVTVWNLFLPRKEKMSNECSAEVDRMTVIMMRAVDSNPRVWTLPCGSRHFRLAESHSVQARRVSDPNPSSLPCNTQATLFQYVRGERMAEGRERVNLGGPIA